MSYNTKSLRHGLSMYGNAVINNGVERSQRDLGLSDHDIVDFSSAALGICKELTQQVELLLRRVGQLEERLSHRIPLKTCSCGQVWWTIPETAKLRALCDELDGQYWECGCGSTLFAPGDA